MVFDLAGKRTQHTSSKLFGWRNSARASLARVPAFVIQIKNLFLNVIAYTQHELLVFCSHTRFEL